MQELVFYAGPFLLLIGLLLSGRFIGEEAILARRPSRRPAAARRPALDAGARAPARLAARAQHASAARPAGRRAAPRLSPFRSSSRRRSRCGPSPAPWRRPRCCSARPSRSPTRATRTTAPSSRRSRPTSRASTLGAELRRRLLLHNTSGKDVTILDYEGKPYAQLLADGTVQVNTNSEAYYLNEDRLGETAVPKDLGAEPKWKQVSQQLALRVARPPGALDGQGRPAAASRTRTPADEDLRQLGGPDRGRRRRRARSRAR